MNRKLNKLVDLFKESLGLFLSITFGIFLFVLFFQPFPIEQLEFNNRLLFVAGFGAIVFLLMVIVRMTFQTFIPSKYYQKDESQLLSYASGFLILSLCAVALAFYLRYVGQVSITFFIMFRVVFICLVPAVVLWLFDEFQELKLQNELLVSEKETIKKKIDRYEEDYQNKTIEFISEYSADNLVLSVTEVVLIKSADNYVEIVFQEGQVFKKKLIRNTLKNIELQVKPFSNFVRSHRTSIVNVFFVENLSRKQNNHWLTLKGYDEPVPVSRQYLLKLKEIL